jgi:hypothetical protein
MRTLKFLLAVLLILTLASCSITEKLIVKENFFTEVKLGIDMSSFFKLENKIKPDNKEYIKIDSTYSFSELLKLVRKDSIDKIIKGDSQKLELFSKMNFQLNIDEENSIYKCEIDFDIENINDVPDFSKSGSIFSLLFNSEENFGDLSFIRENDKRDSETKFFYDGKIFTRKTIFLKDDELTKESKNSKNEKSKSKSENNLLAKFDDKLDEINKELTYKIEYHFPKKIQTVSLKEAVISSDKKSFTFVLPLEDYELNSNLDFQIVFEK